MNPQTGRVRVARGIIAVGGVAQGVVAVGGFAMGGITFGGFSLGLLAYGGFGVGVITLAGFSLALLAGFGGFVAAPIAIGGEALGYLAYGGKAIGTHALDSSSADPVAQRFFLPWAKKFFEHFNTWNLVLIFLTVGAASGLPVWLQWKLRRDQEGPPRPPGSSSTRGSIALLLVALGGILGIVALCLLPHPPQFLVWSALVSALAGTCIGIASRASWAGKRAIAVGSISTATWLLVALICAIKQPPSRQTTSAALTADTNTSPAAQEWPAPDNAAWVLAGSAPDDYVSSTNNSVSYHGKLSASLRSKVSEPRGFATLMQTVQADAFRGKRVRFSGFVRSQDVADWAGLWMRLDGPQDKTLAFDNMGNRPIKATTRWTRYEVVLDVAPSANQIAFGLLLAGKGEVWMADLNLESADENSPTTGLSQPRQPLKQPKLSFGNN
jgi:hypothetical protein